MLSVSLLIRENVDKLSSLVNCQTRDVIFEDVSVMVLLMVMTGSLLTRLMLLTLIMVSTWMLPIKLLLFQFLFRDRANSGSRITMITDVEKQVTTSNGHYDNSWTPEILIPMLQGLITDTIITGHMM